MTDTRIERQTDAVSHASYEPSVGSKHFIVLVTQKRYIQKYYKDTIQFTLRLIFTFCVIFIFTYYMYGTFTSIHYYHHASILTLSFVNTKYKFLRHFSTHWKVCSIKNLWLVSTVCVSLFVCNCEFVRTRVQ